MTTTPIKQDKHMDNTSKLSKGNSIRSTGKLTPKKSSGICLNTRWHKILSRKGCANSLCISSESEKKTNLIYIKVQRKNEMLQNPITYAGMVLTKNVPTTPGVASASSLWRAISFPVALVPLTGAPPVGLEEAPKADP